MGNSNEAASKDSSDSSAKLNMFPQRPVAILQFRDGKWCMVQPPTIANQRDLTILTYNIWFDKSHRRRRFEALMDCVFSPKDCDMPGVVCFQVSVSGVHHYYIGVLPQPRIQNAFPTCVYAGGMPRGCKLDPSRTKNP